MFKCKRTSKRAKKRPTVTARLDTHSSSTDATLWYPCEVGESNVLPQTNLMPDIRPNSAFEHDSAETNAWSEMCATTTLRSSVPTASTKFEAVNKETEDLMRLLLVPTLPMLAKPTDSFDNVVVGVQERAAICEEKYDGERLLCAVTGETQTFYTRTLKLTACPFHVNLNVGYRYCLFDGERVYVDASGANVAICDTGVRSDLRQCYRVFDVQYVNGRPLFNVPLRARKTLLTACLQETADVKLVPYYDGDDLKRRFDRTVGNGGEGLMVKPLDSLYTPNRRDDWIKLKALHLRDYREEFDMFAYRALKDKDGLYGVLECG